MKFYKYWAHAVDKAIAPDGGVVFRSAVGFSDISVQDAFKVAEQRAQKNARYWLNRAKIDDPAKAEEQYYPATGERPIREEVIEQFSENDEIYAIVSRNSYGCLVLNTSDVFFADVDKPYTSKSNLLLAWIKNLFVKNTTKKPSFEELLIEKIETLIATDSNLGLRVYRTLMGYRVLLTNQTVPASKAKSIDLLKQLGSDELYVSLCRSQDCYRARLTPKAWRCGSEKPKIRFPFSTPEKEQEFREWEQQYDAIAAKYATCVLIGEFGAKQVDPRVAAVSKLHDMFVLNEGKPLA